MSACGGCGASAAHTEHRKPNALSDILKQRFNTQKCGASAAHRSGPRKAAENKVRRICGALRCAHPHTPYAPLGALRARKGGVRFDRLAYPVSRASRAASIALRLAIGR